MAFNPNPLFFEMAKTFQDNYNGEEKIIICNEGGSRSSKTFDTFHFIYAYCDHNRGAGEDIYILRETLVKCRDFTFKDFKKCMSIIGATDLEYRSEGAKPYVNLFGNNIYFRGLDDEKNSEGYPSDVLFINEALETEKSQVDGLKMRCRKLMIMDWNPKYTDHWCFKLEGQPGVFFTRTNYTNNKHLEKSVVTEIESYEPWLPGSYEVVGNTIMYAGKPINESNQPPLHPTNHKNSTADSFRWKVYGLGLRGAMEGLIFKNVTTIDEFPQDLGYTYANDFGFTNDPNVTVKYSETETDIYLECLCYEPIETPEALAGFWTRIGLERDLPITCDSADKYTSGKKGSVEMVQDLCVMGWNASKVIKSQSIVFWINSMRNKRINIVANSLYWDHVKKEVENYIWKEINGIPINQPVDKYNHFWDAARYAHMDWSMNADIEVDWC